MENPIFSRRQRALPRIFLSTNLNPLMKSRTNSFSNEPKNRTYSRNIVSNWNGVLWENENLFMHARSGPPKWSF